MSKCDVHPPDSSDLTDQMRSRLGAVTEQVAVDRRDLEEGGDSEAVGLMTRISDALAKVRDALEK